MAGRKKEETVEIDIVAISRGIARYAIVGDSPLIMNRLAEKARRELLLPKGRKTAAEKQGSLKHDPLREFQASPYRMPDPKSPTLLAILSTAFKGALRTAALDTPGVNKTQIGRLTYIAGEYVEIYGIPKLLMSVTRSADMNRTPDIRTRTIVPQWAAIVEVSFATPILRQTSISTLLANAGITVGVGDWRPEKGAGAYGRFRIVSPDDAEFKAIVKAGGRAAQAKAMENPEFYDTETEELYEWSVSETTKRGFKKVEEVA